MSTENQTYARDMLLRDFFAARIAAAIVTHGGINWQDSWIVENAYQIADAMLAERSKPKEQSA